MFKSGLHSKSLDNRQKCAWSFPLETTISCFTLQAPKHTHDNIDTAADNTMDVVQDLLQSLEEAASQAGVVNSMIEKLTKSITKVCTIFI